MTKNISIINKLFTVTYIALGLVLSYIASPGFVFSEELPPVGDVVQKLQSTYEGTKDLKADFIQETTIKSIKKVDREEGRFFFKNPRNMSWNYEKPKGKKLVINSQIAWLYLLQEKAAYKQKSESIFQSKFLLNFFSGTGKLNDDFIVRYAQPKALDKDRNYVLKFIPKERNAACKSVRLIIDKNNFYILQLSFDDALGNSTMLKFSSIAINTGLDPKLFQFQPPAGVQIFEVP